MRVRTTICAATTAAVLALGAGTSTAAAQAPDNTAGPDGEVVGLLQELIRVNTSNPPGNEALVAELLGARLAPLGFEVEVLPTPTAGKAHLIARLRAQNPTQKPLLLAGHADVVGVERELWNVDPFAGLVRGGNVIGRGAMDFKGGLAAFTVAAMRLARSKSALNRDVILLAEADEEGGEYGTSWLAKNHWAKIDAGVSLNEGGWILEDRTGTPRLMGITTVDKNSLSVTCAPVVPRPIRRGRCPTAPSTGSRAPSVASAGTRRLRPRSTRPPGATCGPGHARSARRTRATCAPI